MQVPLDKYGYNSIARHVFTGIITSVLLFLGAGSLSWDWGWGYSVGNTLGWLVMSLALARTNPALLNQRGKPARQLQKGTKRWDYILLTAYTLLMLITPVVAGLDYRYSRLLDFHPLLRILGVVLLWVGFYWLTWAMSANKFFEPIVRVQADKQVIASNGPYRFVRHPGYLGVILQFLAVPLILGSLYSLIPVLLATLVFIVRIWLEDGTLQRELPGYADYAQKTRYRLIPFVW